MDDSEFEGIQRALDLLSELWANADDRAREKLYQALTQRLEY
jgi:hypothetical protein